MDEYNHQHFTQKNNTSSSFFLKYVDQTHI